MDTLRTAKDPQAAGIAATQAEAILDHAITGDLVRKEDLTAALTPIRTDLAVLKWMMGFTLAALVAILTRVYG